MSRMIQDDRQRTLFPLLAGDPAARPTWGDLPPGVRKHVEELLGRLVVQHWVARHQPPPEEEDGNES